MSNKECAPIDTMIGLYGYMREPPEWGRLTASLSKRSKCVKNRDLCADDRRACHFPESSPRAAERHEYGSVPKTLVCHDMKNGYREDRFIDGVKDNSCYLFYHWAAIDIFVYFSHHFITIPPLGWINVAHKHGVRIMGTIITEWENGVKICEEFLQSESVMQNFANQLVAVAKYFKLDGWFLNIENAIDNLHCHMLLKFVKYLTERMHGAVDGSLVIWYDSVTNDGSLTWQNSLNRKNKDYFDCCDGIFLNYVWSRSHLEETVTNAGNRKHDVFVGIDVWGRGLWGGGRFNTSEAVKEVFNYDLSLAIFAPGWTHEAIEHRELCAHLRSFKYPCYSSSGFISNDYSRLQRDYFLLRESALWNTLWPYLNSRGPTTMPFHTYFCLGSGEKRRYGGNPISNDRWFNLREQQYQPSNPTCFDNFRLELVQSSHRKRETTTTANDLDDSPTEGCKEEQQSSDDCIEDVITATDATPTEASPSSRDRPVTKRFKVKANSQPGCLLHQSKDSYYGGTCLKICPASRSTNDENDIAAHVRMITRIFVCEFHCDFNFIVYCITKRHSKEKYQDLALILTVQNKRDDEISTVVLSNENARQIRNDKEMILAPLNAENEDFKTIERNTRSAYPGFWIDPDNRFDWKIRYYNVICRNSVILNIDCELENDSSPMLLGGLGIVKDVLAF